MGAINAIGSLVGSQTSTVSPKTDPSGGTVKASFGLLGLSLAERLGSLGAAALERKLGFGPQTTAPSMFEPGAVIQRTTTAAIPAVVAVGLLVLLIGGAVFIARRK